MSFGRVVEDLGPGLTYREAARAFERRNNEQGALDWLRLWADSRTGMEIKGQAVGFAAGILKLEQMGYALKATEDALVAWPPMGRWPAEEERALLTSWGWVFSGPSSLTFTHYFPGG